MNRIALRFKQIQIIFFLPCFTVSHETFSRNEQRRESALGLNLCRKGPLKYRRQRSISSPNIPEKIGHAGFFSNSDVNRPSHRAFLVLFTNRSTLRTCNIFLVQKLHLTAKFSISHILTSTEVCVRITQDRVHYHYSNQYQTK